MLKRIIKAELIFFTIIGLLTLLSSCKRKTTQKALANNFESALTVKNDDKAHPLSNAFKAYWYNGEAEISSYTLEQARYGEIHQGHAVLIYVTEDFLPNKQIKADHKNPESISVLKLNASKKFNTGIYPYSIMQSTFYPVANNQQAIKISSSVQEWCGHVYTQLNNRKEFEIDSHSYFENEADQQFSLKKAILENELWTKLRIDPKSLPTGTLEIIPSFEYTRLRHKPIKAYIAKALLTTNTYTLSYPELNRTLSITFNPNFPYDIISWEETFKSGFGQNAKVLTTKASKLKTIKLPYWKKNSKNDKVLRDALQLK